MNVERINEGFMVSVNANSVVYFFKELVQEKCGEKIDVVWTTGNYSTEEIKTIEVKLNVDFFNQAKHIDNPHDKRMKVHYLKIEPHSMSDKVRHWLLKEFNIINTDCFSFEFLIPLIFKGNLSKDYKTFLFTTDRKVLDTINFYFGKNVSEEMKRFISLFTLANKRNT